MTDIRKSNSDFETDDQLTLKEIDKLIQTKRNNFTYTLRDIILFLLYAKRKPIKGKTKQQKEVFLAMKLVFNNLPVQPIYFKKHHYGPYSEEVGNTIDQLVFSNHLNVSGKKVSNDFAIMISPDGMNHIKNKFNALPEEIKNDLEHKREQWDTHTPAGILNVVYTHFPEYLEKSRLKKRYQRLDWNNDSQELKKHDN